MLISIINKITGHLFVQYLYLVTRLIKNPQDNKSIFFNYYIV